MQKSCEDITEMLVDYTDGRLSPGKSSEVAEHLVKCESCQRTLQALQRSLELTGIIWEDGLAETEAIRIPIPKKVRKSRWPRYAAIAASIVFLAGGSLVWRSLTRPTKPELTFAEIERRITDSASAARLLAATELLAGQPYAKDFANSQYRYIVDWYPDTEAAARARSKVNRLK